jgi:hypothetical protein
MALLDLEARLRYEKARNDQLDQAQIDKFNGEFAEILLEEHEAWKSVRSKESSAQSAAKKQR